MKEEEVPVITSAPTIGVSSFSFKDSKFPSFNITLSKSAAKSSIYTKEDVKPSQGKSPSKKSNKLEQQRKAADDTISSLSYYDLLKTVTRCPDIKIKAPEEPKPIEITQEEALTMIGKRAKPEAAAEDNPVESVDFI
jgi:hypothetical protein